MSLLLPLFLHLCDKLPPTSLWSLVLEFVFCIIASQLDFHSRQPMPAHRNRRRVRSVCTGLIIWLWTNVISIHEMTALRCHSPGQAAAEERYCKYCVCGKWHPTHSFPDLWDPPAHPCAHSSAHQSETVRQNRTSRKQKKPTGKSKLPPPTHTGVQRHEKNA